MEDLVTFRHATIDDAAVLVGALENAHLDDFSLFENPITEEIERQYIQRVIDSGNYLFLIFNQSERLVGTIGLHEVDRFNKTARVGLTIFETSDRGHHYGKASIHKMIKMAFTELDIEKLYANVLSTNKKQIAWDKSVGFHFESHLSGHYLLRGRRRDMESLVLLKSDWLLRGHDDGKAGEINNKPD